MIQGWQRALRGTGRWYPMVTDLNHRVAVLLPRFNKFLGNGENKDSSPPKEMGKAQEQAENLRASSSESLEIS